MKQEKSKKILKLKERIKELEYQLEDAEFYVCPQHQGTGGYESCCDCEGDKLCTEATR